MNASHLLPAGYLANFAEALHMAPGVGLRAFPPTAAYTSVQGAFKMAGDLGIPPGFRYPDMGPFSAGSRAVFPLGPPVVSRPGAGGPPPPSPLFSIDGLLGRGGYRGSPASPREELTPSSTGSHNGDAGNITVHTYTLSYTNICIQTPVCVFLLCNINSAGLISRLRLWMMNIAFVYELLHLLTSK